MITNLGELGGAENETEARSWLEFVEPFTGWQPELSAEDKIAAANLFNKRMTEIFQLDEEYIHEDFYELKANYDYGHTRTVIVDRTYGDGSNMYIKADANVDYQKVGRPSPCELTVFETKPDGSPGIVHGYCLDEEFASVIRHDVKDLAERVEIGNRMASLNPFDPKELELYKEEMSRWNSFVIAEAAERSLRTNSQPVSENEIRQLFELMAGLVVEGGLVVRQ